MTLELLPAVDIAAGAVVRRSRDHRDSDPGFADPVEAALHWQREGARRLHLVDLDAAFGRGPNTELLAGVIRRLDIPVQLSGGIADRASLRAALASGADRVNLSSAALLDRQWLHHALEEHGARLSMSLDVRGRTIAPRGGSATFGDVLETLAELERAGCQRYVVTDVDRDGTAGGPNLELLREVCAATDRPVVASGGVGALHDLRELAAVAGLEAVIVGRALYDGGFTLADAMRLLSGV
jgi:phosphoribosylanthranilate isomerase